MVTTLYLVRHGETEGQDRQCYHGSTDVGLSAAGRAQIRSTAAFIRGRSNASAPGTPQEGALAAVYCSGLKRATDSAVIIAGLQGLKPLAVADLGERSFGLWEGLTFSEIEKRHPEGFAAWLANPLGYSPEGGENALQVKARALRAIESLVARHPNSSIAVVAHGGVNRLILAHLLGMPPENFFRIEQDYGAVNIMEFWDGYPVVKLMNGLPGR